MTASAQKNPTFQYADKPKEEEKPKKVEWSAQAQAGFLQATGNTRQTVLTGGAKAVRKAGFNKLQIELGGAFARTTVLQANDINANGTIDDEGEIVDVTATSAQSWELKGRYDRFLSEHNSLYVQGLISADEPAGKELVGGGQLGYSRQLYKSERHEVVSELGYDFTYESFVTADDAVAIHSGRLFAGYTGKLTEVTAFVGSAEFLANFNSLNAPGGEVDAFEDLRFTGKAELTTKLLEDISLNVSFAAKLDNAPAPRAALAVPYAAGFVPLADKLDTLTKIAIIVNFL